MKQIRLAVLSMVAAAALLAACHPGRVRATVWEGPVTREDSVGLAGRTLWNLVRRLDEFGRTTGKLPATLAPVLEAPRTGTDPWGRSIRYTPDSLTFELRSAGADGVLESNDDVVALGRVGRNLPCETRDEYRTERYEHIVAPCDTSPTMVLPLCPPLLQLRPIEQPPATPRDSVLLTGRRLVRFARIIEGVARERGGLPPALAAVPGQPRFPDWGLPDAWDRRVEYTPRGQRFELRSAGPDARLHSADDIVVAGQLGQVIPCEFRAGDGVLTCDVPPPACP
jgi:hypothetical protein